MDGDNAIDPWSSEGVTNYSRIVNKFGLRKLDPSLLPNPGLLHRRGIVFAHRDLDVAVRCIKDDSPLGVLTGLMPSGGMHLGHSMVIEQVKWFQQQGADVTVAVADLEALATRGISLSDGRKSAIEEYVLNYAALGLDPSKSSVYFQSARPDVQRLGFKLGRRTNLSEFEAIYGFSGDTNLAHVQAPMVQVGDIVHPQLEEYGGLRPIVVPVGIDQDPHLRLTRDIIAKTHWFNINPRKSGGVTISLSIQDDNSKIFGVDNRGRINKEIRSKIFQSVVEIVSTLGFADVIANPKHGTLEIPGATSSDKYPIRLGLLKLERELGGLGLMTPCSTYHRFAPGMTGGKMSSSNPESTIFMNDTIETMSKKVKRAVSGGKSTVEEHRRLGGDCSKDVAFQYLEFFFEKDDIALYELKREYESGRILAGEMKKLCIEKASLWLEEISEKREMWRGRLSEFLAPDSR